MSTGRWAKRGWAFQGWAFAPWALAGGSSTTPTAGNPSDGWTFLEENRVWLMTDPETVFAFSQSHNIWNFTNEHIID